MPGIQRGRRCPLNRSAIGLGVLAALLLLGNIYQLTTIAALDAEVRDLKVDLETAENELAVIRQVAARQVARPAAAARPSPRSRRPVAKNKASVGGAGVVGDPTARPGRPSPEKVEAVREQVRDRALERIFVLIEKMGQAEGWDGQTISQAQSIIETQFLANGELREQARNGDIAPEEARAEVERMREEAATALDELLGVEAHAMLRDRIRSPGR